MVEFEDSFSERMAQLEQEDLERYQRDRLNNSSNSYHDETPNYVDEFQSKLSELLDMVHQLSSDLKRTTSSIENRTALNDASCNYSILESEADEQPGEVLMLNELPNSKELLDFDDIKENHFSNSEAVLELEENKVSEYGLQVLSIFCAHMASKWNNILELRPKQSRDMSVEVYYDLFFDWKKKLEDVSYIGGEESHIDDFIYGLELKLGMRVWGYKWKPRTLYGAFRRAVIEQTMMKNDADKVLEEMPHPNSLDSRGAKNVSDEYSNVQLDASLGSEFIIKASLLGKDSEPIQLLLQKYCGHNERKVADGGVVLSLFDMNAYLGLLGDLSMIDSKAFGVSGKYVIEDDTYEVFGEITQAIRAALLDEEVMNRSAKYDDFNKLILFDPGGSRKCAMSFNREATRLLIGKAQGMVVWGFEGVTSTHSHVNSFLYTSYRNSLQTLFHDMDKCTAAMMILGALKCPESEMVHLFIFIHPEDVVPAGLSIQRVHFKLAGRALLALAYIEHMAYTLLGNNLSYQKEVVRRITHKDFHLLEQLHVGLINKFLVPIVIEVAHLGEMFKFHVNLQCIGAVFVMIIIQSVRCRPFDPGGNLLLQMEGNILKADALSLVLVINQRETFSIINYILVDKDAFKRVGKWIIAMDHRTELIILLKFSIVRAADLLFRKCSSQPSIQKNEGNTDSKEVMVLVRMSFYTHLMKFAQLTSWSLESAKLTGWSNVLSYIHNFVNIGLVQRGNYPHDSLQPTLCSNILMNGAEWNLKIERCWSTWNMIHKRNMLRGLNEDLKHFQQHLSTYGYLGIDVTKFLKAVMFPSLSYSILGNVLNMGNCGCEELCVKALDKTIENSLKPFVKVCDKQGNVLFVLMIWEVWYNICTSKGELSHVPFTPIVNIHGNKKYLSLVECSKDYVADITPLYFDKAWFAVRIGNYEMPWSIANCSKSTFSWWN